jgi:hypothetical protein
MLAVLRMREELVDRAGSSATTLAPEELELPGTLTSAIAARLEALSAETRSVLIRAAFLGGAF